MSHFLISYAGNKQREFKYFKHVIQLDNIKSIIEPFCGSSAMSFLIWLEHKNKFNYYLNDKDNNLLKIYNLIKNEDINDIYEKINEIKTTIITKKQYIDLYEIFLINQNIYEYLTLKLMSFRGTKNGRTPDIKNGKLKNNSLKPNKFKILFSEFIKSPNVFFTNDDWNDCYNKFKDDKEALILFDPPYINSDNVDFYKHRKLDVYDNINDIYNNNARSYFIIEKIDKTDELFKEWNELVVYNKMYNTTQKKTQHIVYSNLLRLR